MTRPARLGAFGVAGCGLAAMLLIACAGLPDFGHAHELYFPLDGGAFQTDESAAEDGCEHRCFLRGDKGRNEGHKRSGCAVTEQQFALRLTPGSKANERRPV